ncbi:MAG: aminotransferase class III-fold pyridoxal phosphate-dependent enzyme, partial [Pseudomonadota bacterium]
MSNAPQFEHHIKQILGVSDLRAMRGGDAVSISRGDGVWVFDEQGKKYLEACSSYYCAGLGFGFEKEILSAISDQLRQLSFYVSAASKTTDVTTQYAEKLADLSPLDDPFILFGCSGSEANDFLIKAMRYANIANGRPRKQKVISRIGGYHGGTISTSALGGDNHLHKSFGLAVQGAPYISQPDYFGQSKENESEAEYVKRLISELDRTIELADPNTIGALILEPVNFSAGFFVPPSGYLERVSETLSKHDIKLFVDEVVTGFGRLGSYFGSTVTGLHPDCVTIGKSMSAAYFPISAAIISRDLYADIEKGSDQHGLFAHAGTYAGHPIGAAIGLKVLEIFEQRQIIEHVNSVATHFARQIELLANHPLVANVRKMGLAGA